MCSRIASLISSQHISSLLFILSITFSIYISDLVSCFPCFSLSFNIFNNDLYTLLRLYDPTAIHSLIFPRNKNKQTQTANMVRISILSTFACKSPPTPLFPLSIQTETELTFSPPYSLPHHRPSRDPQRRRRQERRPGQRRPVHHRRLRQQRRLLLCLLCRQPHRGRVLC